MNITNEFVAAWLHEFYRPLGDDLYQIRQLAEAEGIPIILKDTEMFLLSLMQMKKPKHILEIGTAVGYSTACFARGATDASIVTIESDKRMIPRALGNFNALGVEERIRLFYGDGAEVIETIPEEQLFDFVFIDAAKGQYKRFWDAAITRCTQDALIISDNVLMNGAVISDEYDPEGKYRTSTQKMRKFIQELMADPHADTSILAIGDGVAVSVLKNLPPKGNI